MLILAFDCSGPACSVALWRDGAVLAQERELMERGQAEALMPMIDRVMKAGDLGFAALDRIAVTVGPGSFTGVRAGLAAARGFALASNIPAIGILTTTVLAAAVPPEERRTATRILVAIDTKRGDLYVHQFETDSAPSEQPIALPATELAAWVAGSRVMIAGDAATVAALAIGGRAMVSSAGGLVDTGVLASLAARAAPQPDGPVPVYVHPPAVTLPGP